MKYVQTVIKNTSKPKIFLQSHAKYFVTGVVLQKKKKNDQRKTRIFFISYYRVYFYKLPFGERLIKQCLNGYLEIRRCQRNSEKKNSAFGIDIYLCSLTKREN